MLPLDQAGALPNSGSPHNAEGGAVIDQFMPEQVGDPQSPDAIHACWIIFRLCLMPPFPYRDNIQLLD
jgi:hypothetical protein